MNTRIRLLLALALLAAIVIAGMGAPAWASRLNIGGPASGAQVGLLVGSRPQGTVSTTAEVITITEAGRPFTLGSVAVVSVAPPGAGETTCQLLATVVPQSAVMDIGSLPGQVLSAGVQISCPAGDTALKQAVTVTFPIVPGKTSVPYFWNGTAWVAGSATVVDGQVSVTAPAGTPLAVTFALFDK